MQQPDPPAASRFSPPLWALALGYIALVLAMRLLAQPNGWAAVDARGYHLPVINHFIAQGGISLDYPLGLSMFAGMHAAFAKVALALGFGPLPYDSLAAFGVQSIFGLAYVALLVATVRVLLPQGQHRPLLFIIAASSSYVLASWLWPTTDVLSFTFYLAFVLLCALPPSPSVVIAGVVVAALTPFVRQNYAVLASAFAFRLVLEALMQRAWPSFKALVLSALPFLAALGALGVLFSLWGGLVPPDRAGVETGFSPATPFHALALAGVLCWPFARLLWGAENRGMPALLLACLITGLALAFIIPFEFNLAPGRNGSYVWQVLERLPAGVARKAAFGLMGGAGLYVLAGVIIAAWRARQVPPELAVFAPLFAALFLQRIAFQRYVELPLFLAIAGPSLRLMPLPRWRLALILLWFGLLFALGLAKELGFTPRQTIESPQGMKRVEQPLHPAR